MPFEHQREQFAKEGHAVFGTANLCRVYLAQYAAEAVLGAGTRHLRRKAIPVLRRGQRITAP